MYSYLRPPSKMAGAYWEPVFDWISDDAAIAAWLNQAQKDVLTNAQVAELPIWRDFMRFQGFDIKRIIRNMITRRAAYVATAPNTEIRKVLTEQPQQVVFSYFPHATLAQDIELIIFLFAERGNTIRKIEAKSFPELRKVIDVLIAKYDLDVTPHPAGDALEPDVVSIARVVACFPIKICEYFHRGYGKLLCQPREIGFAATDNITKSVCCPHLVAMLPTAALRTTPRVHVIVFLCHLRVDEVIHRKDRRFTATDTMLTYYKAEFRTPITNQASRLGFCRMAGLVNADDDNFTNPVLAAVDPAVALLRLAIGNEADTNRVIGELELLV